MDELDPQVKVLLEQLSAGASQQSAPALSMKEKIAAIRQRMGALAAFGFPSEPVYSRATCHPFDGPGVRFALSKISKSGLHYRQYHNVIKGALLPRFARMSLIDLMIVGTLNHRVPGSSPGAPTKKPLSPSGF